MKNQINTQDKLPKRYDITVSLVDKELTNIYGMRYAEYRRLYALAGEFKYEPDFPLYLMLEQTFSCNLKCPSCIHAYPAHKRKFNMDIRIMPLSIFERIILEGEENKCPSIIFNVNDEPLLVKDLASRVKFAKDHGFMDLFITTNGNLLNPVIMKSLVKSGITRILFSIDAATPQTYGKVRPGGNLSKVISNLKALTEYKKNNKSVLPAIRVSFVANRLNMHEFRLFIQKFSGLADYLEVQEFSTYYDANDALIPEDATHTDNFYCTEPWRKLIIRANGDVLPCCTFYGYEIILGNILRSSLTELFNGRLCRQLRADFKEGKYKLKPCISCSRSFYKSRSV